MYIGFESEVSSHCTFKVTVGVKYSIAEIGDTVKVRVPDVDRACSDRRYILTTMIEIRASNV